MPIKTRQIVLISCENSIQEVMQVCLETILNCEAIVANSGAEGIERAAIELPRAILLDLDETMPDLSWREIICNLKQNSSTNNIPLILLTASPQSQELIRLQQITELEPVVKSFDLLNLASQISRLLRWN
ncbi:response regulator [Myxosarcina sp. GI1(2024)]